MVPACLIAETIACDCPVLRAVGLAERLDPSLGGQVVRPSHLAEDALEGSLWSVTSFPIMPIGALTHEMAVTRCIASSPGLEPTRALTEGRKNTHVKRRGRRSLSWILALHCAVGVAVDYCRADVQLFADLDHSEEAVPRVVDLWSHCNWYPDRHGTQH